LFDLSKVPNSISLSLPLLHQTQFVAELEERHTLWGQPGKIKVLYWLSRGNLGTYSDALALGAATGTTPSTQAVANYRSKYGMAFNLEQQIAADLGMFVKGGWSQGGVQEDDFTDINASTAAGLSLAGTRWGRPDDTVGLAAVVNEISAIGSQYLAAGGLAASSAMVRCSSPAPSRSWRLITASPPSASLRSPGITSSSTTRPITSNVARSQSSRFL
jgi:high affinity Mn2+ porin